MKLSETDKMEIAEKPEAEIDVVSVEMVPEVRQVRKKDKPFVFYEPDKYNVPDLPGEEPITPKSDYGLNPFMDCVITMASIGFFFGGILFDRVVRGNNPETGPSRPARGHIEKA